MATVRVSRSGGFANVRQQMIVDAESLAEPEGRELERLLERTDLDELAQRSQPTGGGADRYQYDVTVADERGQHNVTVSEDTLPPELADLIDWVMTHGRREP